MTRPRSATKFRLVVFAGVLLFGCGVVGGAVYSENLGWIFTALPDEEADAGTPDPDAGFDDAGFVAAPDSGTPDAGTQILDAGTATFDAGTDPGLNCLRIMPLGDSITLGGNGGYRNNLWHALRAYGCGVDFVGSQPDPYALIPDTEHEGHPGWNTGDLLGATHCPGQSSCATGYATAAAPDYVLLMLGTNDVAWFSGEPAAALADTLMTSVSHIQAVRPGVWIVISSILPMQDAIIPPSDLSRVAFANAYNAELKARVAARIAGGERLIWMNGNALLTQPGDFYDGLHPNEAGYSKLANGWFQALQPVLRCTGVPAC